MLRFHAGTFCHALAALEQARGFLATQLTYDETVNCASAVADALDQLDRQLELLPLSSTLRYQITTIRRSVNQGADARFIAALLTSLENSIFVELAEWGFLAIPPGRRHLYATPAAVFGNEIMAAFPDSEPDLKAGARCMALSEWTACVFHLMRGVEAALRKWANQLGVVLKRPVEDANWQEILGAADKALELLENQPRVAGRADELEYFGDTAAQFFAIKNAWRNHVAHGKRTYDEREATEVMQHVVAFMRKLTHRS